MKLKLNENQHWMDNPAYTVLGSWTRCPIRIDAKAMIRLNELKNALEGRRTSLAARSEQHESVHESTN